MQQAFSALHHFIQKQTTGYKEEKTGGNNYGKLNLEMGKEFGFTVLRLVSLSKHVL